MMNNTFELAVVVMMTTIEPNHILEDAIAASERFGETVDKEFINGKIDYETATNLSTFFVTAFLKAVKNRSETGIACHLEKFDEELQNIDAVCENNPELFRSNYNLTRAVMQFHNTMNELARALGMKN